MVTFKKVMLGTLKTTSFTARIWIPGHLVDLPEVSMAGLPLLAGLLDDLHGNFSIHLMSAQEIDSPALSNLELRDKVVLYRSANLRTIAGNLGIAVHRVRC